MVTNLAVGILGAFLAVVSCVGWFLQVLPEEAHEDVAVVFEEIAVSTERTVRRRSSASPERRKILPVETFRAVTGIKGGIAGGIAMTVPATLYSLIRYHSIWYAMNLLAEG
jgi:hypothetical protein